MVIFSDYFIQKMINDKIYRSEMIYKCYMRQNWLIRGINILDKNLFFFILIYLLIYIYFLEVLGNKFIYVFVVEIFY